jgi:hypothetical protein
MVNAFTLLAMNGQGVQPYSARGLSQTLDPISQASNTRRTVNGVLKDIGLDGFKKFKSTITANDQTAPAMAENWPGRTIVVDCLSELCYLTSGGTPTRMVVPDSSRVEGDYTFYRPRLTMMVLSYAANSDEYNSQVSWSMQLEEV